MALVKMEKSFFVALGNKTSWAESFFSIFLKEAQLTKLSTRMFRKTIAPHQVVQDLTLRTSPKASHLEQDINLENSSSGIGFCYSSRSL